MARIKRGVTSHARHKKILKAARGYYLRRHSTYKTAKECVQKARQNATAHRLLRKREFRSLWVMRINAAARMRGLSYSRFIEGLRKAEIQVNRKFLADMAISDPAAFDEIVTRALAVLN
jgi:large subunit ribosomal protein L20